MKQFFKLTFPKVVATIILIIFFILSRRIAVQSNIPVENIFFKLDLVIFKPAEYIANIFSNANFYYLRDIVYFVFNLVEYYLIASLLIFIFTKLRKYCKNKKH